MTDERHQTHLPAAWGEQLPLWTEPLRTPAGCAATTFVLLCIAPMFLLKSASCVMQPIRERESEQLSRYEDLRLGMALAEFTALPTAPESPQWTVDGGYLWGEPVHRFSVSYPSPYPDWETCEVIFDLPVDPQATRTPSTPLPEAELSYIHLIHQRELSPLEQARTIDRLAARYPSRHDTGGSARWPPSHDLADDILGTFSPNQVVYWYQDDPDGAGPGLPECVLWLEWNDDPVSD